nr:sodium transporter HKT1-like [Ipomoea batatas]GMD47208.1 sodium transporter HKT1-like [Ipomoea batatas]
MMMGFRTPLVFGVNPFLFELSYFLVLSLVGFLALKVSKPRPPTSSFKLNDLDVFFTAVSSATVSSMSTVEMENYYKPEVVVENLQVDRDRDREEGCLRVLGRVILSYILVVHILGSTLVAMYIGLVSSAKHVLKHKAIQLTTFAVFTTVSTFSNCGFVPTNENMIAFNKNPGLLLILIPQILLGNTLFPACLRLIIWFLDKTTGKSEFKHILLLGTPNSYAHLFSAHRSKFLAATVFGLIFLQFALFLSLEWHSHSIAGLTPYEKLVGSLFVVVNSRHAGESTVDLSLLAPPILPLIVVMM